MVETAFELMEYLSQRGAPYGISADQLLDAIPENARQPQVAYEFMKLKDISHIQPLSEGGNPAGDNWLLEDSSVNRGRGADTMTVVEQHAAIEDNIFDGKVLAKAAMTGGALAAGGMATEAVVAGAAGAGAAVEGAAILAAAPAILAGASVLVGIGLLCMAFDDDTKVKIPEPSKEPKYKLVRQPDGKMKRVPK